jgi:hypothetical protein
MFACLLKLSRIGRTSELKIMVNLFIFRVTNRQKELKISFGRKILNKTLSDKSNGEN